MALALILALYVPAAISLIILGLVYLRRRCRSTVLPTIKYATIKPPRQECCAICLIPFHNNDNIADISCSHLFHGTCLAPWLEIQSQCPLCRTKIHPPLRRRTR